MSTDAPAAEPMPPTPWVKRACPKFLSVEMIDAQAGDPNPSQDLLYFTSGSAALAFLVARLNSGRAQPVRVMVQSFNCPNVADAILSAGGRVVLSDVGRASFSMEMEFLERHWRDVDAVLLLHYQGVRHSRLAEIVEFCRAHDIVLIEDLAHCCDVAWRVSGDFAVYSYAFDKPLSCMRGGALRVHSTALGAKYRLLDYYDLLPVEDPTEAQADLSELRRLFLEASEFHYAGPGASASAGRLLSQAFGRRTGERVATGLRELVRIGRAVRGRSSAGRGPEVSRLSRAKIFVLEQQRRTYRDTHERFGALANRILASLPWMTGPRHYGNEWNRVSLLRQDLSTDIDFAEIKVEARNYNWPKPLHLIPRFAVCRVGGESYVNACVASEQVVNIPAWTEEVLGRIEAGRRVDGANVQG